jgi:hypothetical protein
MHRFFTLGLFFLIGSSPLVVTASANSFFITGHVGSVGSNVGAGIDASIDNFATRDFFEITLDYNAAQAPASIVPAGSGQTASYVLLKTAITIFTDTDTLTWTYETPLADNTNHGFSITNNDNFNFDRFNSGGFTGGTFDGPELGGKPFIYWTLLFGNSGATVFSDVSIPTALDAAQFSKEITLIFNGFTTADSIQLSATSISVIPEPAQFGLNMGVVAFMGMALMRRRRPERA